MGSAIAVLGDTSSHGGSIITSASRTLVQGKLVARVSDILMCPDHGPSPIISGSSRFICEGQPVARAGSVTACGAVIVGSATRTVTG